MPGLRPPPIKGPYGCSISPSSQPVRSGERTGCLSLPKSKRMQLQLFQWDLLETGNGHACLARLDFDQAEAHFNRVLGALPGHQVAEAGLRSVQYWQQALSDAEGVEEIEVLTGLWQRIEAFTFPATEASRMLRANLIRHLLSLMNGVTTLYVPPDLCSGYLYLQLGEYLAAETHLRALIENCPGHGRLYGYLADALWLQGRCEIAGGVYATALLVAPQQVNVDALCNRQLAQIIARHGVDLAPVYGFLRGVLPLVDLEIAVDAEATKIYSLLRQAESALLCQDAESIIRFRRELAVLAPEVLDAYLPLQAGSGFSAG